MKKRSLIPETRVKNPEPKKYNNVVQNNMRSIIGFR